MSEFVKIPPPERRKRDVSYYSPDELHQMLVDDGLKHRPIGGSGKRGVQWMTDALARIAAVNRMPVEVAWNAVLDDIEAQTGRRWVVIG